MVAWKCSECGHTVRGFEGEHGSYHGVCPYCGEGYGVCAPNPYAQEWYEKQKSPMLAICFTMPNGKNRYFLARTNIDELLDALSYADYGTVMTIYDVATRKPVERARSRMGWEWCRSVSDVEWLESQGVKVCQA